MLASLLIDRRRHQEADQILQPLHTSRRHDPMPNFLLGINYYLAFDDIERGTNYLFLASKPKEWFRGITTEEKMMEKLTIFLTAGDAMSNVTGTGISYSDSGSGMSRGISYFLLFPFYYVICFTGVDLKLFCEISPTLKPFCFRCIYPQKKSLFRDLLQK